MRSAINVSNTIYKDRIAIVVTGGPSAVDYIGDLSRINRDKYVIFLEAKALTPKVISADIAPDFLLAPFPEKLKDNFLQHFIYRSMLAGVNIKWFLKKEHHYLVDQMKNNFDYNFEPWRPEKGKHKRFRYRSGIYLNDSPYSLIDQIPETQIITDKNKFLEEFPDSHFNNMFVSVEQSNSVGDFVVEDYYNPTVRNGALELRYTPFLNSAAISTYPILKGLGFKKAYLFGMDMTMLGSFEYSAPYVFRSMFHFQLFFRMAHRVWNANFALNKPYFYRPTSEFRDLEAINRPDLLELIRIRSPGSYVADQHHLLEISMHEFIAESIA